MRKLIISMMLAITLLLASCTETAYYNYDEMVEKVIKVEIVTIDSYTKDKDLVLETLSNELIDDFLYELSQIKFIVYWGNRTEPYGTSFCIYYSDDDYDLINPNYTRLKNLRVKCNEEEFKELLKKYYNPL